MSDRPNRLEAGDALAQERRTIQRTPGGGAGMVDPGVAGRFNALCLSGGGIRSAAFCLGAVQALARQGLLKEFHYLSTVSGGGYTGAMLWRLIATLGDVPAAEARLAEPNIGAFNWLRGIRDYTSYLAPRVGLASLDVWAAVALYARNTLVNFCVFLPGLVGFALLPRVWLSAAGDQGVPAGWQGALLLAALACLLWSTFWACLWLPAHAAAPKRAALTVSRIGGWIAAPAVLGWAFPISLFFAWGGTLPGWLGGPRPPEQVIPIAAGIVMLAGYLLAGGCAGLAASRPPAFRRVPALDDVARPGLFWGWNTLGWVLATAVDAALLWLGIRLTRLVPGAGQALALAIFGPAWVVMAHLLHAAACAVCRREVASSWLDREWIARLSATEILAGAGWALFAAACLLLPHGIRYLVGPGTRAHAVAAVSALLSGPLAAWLGRSASTALGSAQVQGMLRRILPNLAAVVASLIFLLGLLMLGSAGGWRAVALAAGGTSCAPLDWAAFHWAAGASCSASFPGLLIGAVLAIGLSALLGAMVNVNRYSLHEMYRNRLARAFLGSARASRQADGFTHFDEGDRVALQAMTTPCGSERRLFPVINVALNLAAGTRTAWTERKAASFTMTPLHCGSAAFEPHGGFVPTAIYGGVRFAPGTGVHLDTAMTISGAAVSPNAGYHSSPTTSFIMTLFNARLGAWMPNPVRATVRAMKISKPRNGFLALIAEMLGWTDDRRAAVFLSDGGHFENLGLYEMLRRRCALIVVVDADCDPGYRYFDLGNAIRKARIDLDVEIAFFPHDQPVPGVAPARPVKRAEIRYPATATLAASLGVLLYLKAHRRPGMPADVVAYAAENAAFPHEATGNQFFTESQFESYRALGEYLASS